MVEEKKPLSCLLSLDFTGEDEILEFAFPYDVAGKTCLSLLDGPEELAFLSHSLKHRDVGFMCCIRDTEHPTIEPHFCGLDVPGQRCSESPRLATIQKYRPDEAFEESDFQRY